MDTTKKIKALLAYNDTNAAQLSEWLGITPQSLSGKFKRNTWNVSDLEKVAEFTKTNLVIQFINKDGTKI